MGKLGQPNFLLAIANKKEPATSGKPYACEHSAVIMLDYTADAELILYAVRYTLPAITAARLLPGFANGEPVCLLQPPLKTSPYKPLQKD